MCADKYPNASDVNTCFVRTAKPIVVSSSLHEHADGNVYVILRGAPVKSYLGYIGFRCTVHDMESMEDALKKA